MRYFTFFLVIIFCLEISALSPKIRTGYIYANKSTTLKKVLYYQAALPKSLIDNKVFIETLLKNNPQLKADELVKFGQQIYLEIPYETKLVRFLRKEKIRNNREISTTSFAKVENKEKVDKKKWSLNSFITTSIGTFNESVEEVSASSNQNSPITIGASTNFPINKDYSLSGSIYISTLEETGVKDSEESTSIPPEIGLTSYLNINKYDLPFTPYLGADIERFSTFNTDERATGESVSTREHSILYATLGVSKLFKVLNTSIFLKASLSQSLVTKSSRKSLFSDEEFSGQKALLFLSVPIYKKVSTHFLFKQHFMEGPTSLSITRYGLGLSYTFF